MCYCSSYFVMLVKYSLYYDIYYLYTLCLLTPVLLKYFRLFILSDILYAHLNNFLKNALGVFIGIVLNVYINL